MNWVYRSTPGHPGLRTAMTPGYVLTYPTRRGPVVRRFSCPQTLDGYVKTLRGLGCAVTFVSPFIAQASLS